MDTILFDTSVMLLFLVKLNVLKYTIYELRLNHCRNPRDFYQLHFFHHRNIYKDKILVGLDDDFKYEKFDKIGLLCLF